MKYGKLSYQRDRLRLQAFVNALDGEASGVLLLGADERPLSFGFEEPGLRRRVLEPSRRRHSPRGVIRRNYRHNNFDLRLGAATRQTRRGRRLRSGTRIFSVIVSVGRGWSCSIASTCSTKRCFRRERRS